MIHRDFFNVNKFIYIGVILIFFSWKASAQEINSKADALFYEYAYADAIAAYTEEMANGPLTNGQLLNLADAYLKLNNFNRAEELYLQVYKKDSTMSTHHFNKMLLAMARTSGPDRVKAFFKTNTRAMTGELVENASLNYELLSQGSAELKFELFNIEGNSPQADFSPTFYKQDRLLFTSGRIRDKKNLYNPSGESFLDIYIARVRNDGGVLNPNPYTAKPLSNFHQATPFYSESLQSLFYVRSNETDGNLAFDENGKNALAIGRVDASGEFQFLLRDLSTSFYYPFYDEEGGKLYFAANFKEGYGGTDLYYVYTNNGLIMSAPENLGPRVNTPGNEIAPYIFEGNLYFASDIFYGLGGMDIYKSELDRDGTFGIPTNLGSGINSMQDDFGLIIRDHGENSLLGYFASNRPGGKGNDDIYGFIVAEKPGVKTFALKGKVANTTTYQGIANASVRILDGTGKQVKEVFSAADGSYRIEIPWQSPITVQATKDLHSVFAMTYEEGDMAALEQGNVNLGIAHLEDFVEEQEEQTVLKLDKFYFARGRATITPEIAAELDKVVNAIAYFPQLQLRIEAHTDSRGSSASNFRLSQQRADAIKNYLESNGVPSSNILYSIGYGEDKILNNCTNGVYCLEVLHKRNERHLIVVLNYNLLN